MNPFVIITGYLTWHYTKAFADIFVVWGNFLWFVLHFFSVPVLFRTLFSPWRRLHEVYQKGFDPGAFFGTLIVNLIMRVVGVAIRIAFIIIGLVFFLFVLVTGILFFLFWIIAPLALFIMVTTGITLLGP